MKTYQKQLRHLIRQLVLEVRHPPLQAAGIVVLRMFNDTPKVLILKTDEEFMDLPKGRIEDGEDCLQTALRETEEESGLSDIRFPWGMQSIRCSRCKMYVGVTEGDPVIQKNPETGAYEHTDYEWVDPAMAASVLKPYLRPAIDWAMQQISS